MCFDPPCTNIKTQKTHPKARVHRLITTGNLILQGNKCTGKLWAGTKNIWKSPY